MPTVAEIQQKYEREREKVGERKFWISVITLSKTKTNCGNAVTEIGEKKFFVAIVAMPLQKMGVKKNK